MDINFQSIDAVIFDLDGVIVDTAHYHYIAWKRLAKELGIDLTLADNERLKGVSRIDSLNIILSLGNVSLSEEEKIAITDRKNNWFIEYINQMTPDEILPGAKELIVAFRDHGFKVALGSSSKNAKTVLRLLKIEHLFDAVVDGTMITHSKPNPEIFLLGASLLQVDPVRMVVFEDAEAGVEAALAAGMKCVGVGSTAQLGKATMVVANLTDMKVNLPKVINH
jgi:beta-phosphoglucomutase